MVHIMMLGQETMIKLASKFPGSKKGDIGLLDSTLLSGLFGREILSACHQGGWNMNRELN